MKKKIDVCFVAPIKSKYVGGIYVWYKNIISKLGNDSYITIDSSNSFPTHNFLGRILRNVFSFKKLFTQKRELIKYIKKYVIGTLHIASSGGNGYLRDYVLLKTAKKHNIKTVLHLHYGKVSEEFETSKMIGKYCRKALNLSDKILVLDKKSMLFLQNKKIACKLLNNPVDIMQNVYNQNSKQIIFVGHVIPEKGICELLRAFENVIKIFPEITLKIIGPFKQKFLDSIKLKYGLKNVYFCGELKHSITLEEISKSKMLILPSYTEGMPNVVLESMSLSVPVIATDVGNIPSMIEGAGVLIHPKSDLEIYNAIMYLLNNEEICLLYSKAGKDKIVNEYNLDEILFELSNIWKE